jgi:prophage regulatory protein
MAENLIRLSEVQRRVPYSRSTIYLKVARNEFPQPVSLGARAVAWVESEGHRFECSAVASAIRHGPRQSRRPPWRAIRHTRSRGKGGQISRTFMCADRVPASFLLPQNRSFAY